MKKSVKAIIAAAAASFMCAVPTVSAVSNVPTINSISASASYTPNLWEDFDDNLIPEVTNVSDLTKKINLCHVDYTINTKNKTATIMGIDNADSRIKIPAQIKVNGVLYKITKITDNAFKDKDGVTKENGRLKMGAPLTKIDLTAAKYLEDIGTNAFMNCKQLKSIEIPGYITKIEANAFANAGLTEVTFSRKNGGYALTIESGAFSGCSSLSTAYVNRLMASDSDKTAFNGCNSDLRKHIIGDYAYTSIFKRIFFK